VIKIVVNITMKMMKRMVPKSSASGTVVRRAAPGGYPTRGGWVGQGHRQIRSYLVRCANMASQAFSASANVLKGDPPILMAVLLKLMGRQEATKPGRPWSPGPLLLSLLITNEKPRSLALHISSACVAGATRLKCRAIP
jgi:hypothetical protein